MAKLEQFKKDLVEACVAFKARGMNLVRNDFEERDALTEKICGGCALTALGMEKFKLKTDYRGMINLDVLFVRTAEEYDIPPGEDDFLYAFTDGFDGKSLAARAYADDKFAEDIYAVGVAVAAEVLS